MSETGPRNDRFDYVSPRFKVLFGAGRIEDAAKAVEAVGGTRALVLSTPGHEKLAGDVAKRLGKLASGVFAAARMHTPLTVTEDAMKVVERQRIDCAVSIGGGSTIGLGKAIALRRRADGRHPDDLCRLGNDAHLGDHRGRPEADRQDSRVLPRIRHLRPRLDHDPAGSAVGDVSGMNAIAHAARGSMPRTAIR